MCVLRNTQAQDTRGKRVTLKLDGFRARVFQHEYDHLERKLFIDRMTPEVLGSVREDLDRFEGEFGDTYPELCALCSAPPAVEAGAAEAA